MIFFQKLSSEACLHYTQSTINMNSVLALKKKAAKHSKMLGLAAFFLSRSNQHSVLTPKNNIFASGSSKETVMIAIPDSMNLTVTPSLTQKFWETLCEVMLSEVISSPY